MMALAARIAHGGGRVRSFRVTGFRRTPDHIRTIHDLFIERESETASGAPTRRSRPRVLRSPYSGSSAPSASFGRSPSAGRDAAARRASGPPPGGAAGSSRYCGWRRAGAPGAFCPPGGGSVLCWEFFSLNDFEARVHEPLLLIKYIIGSNVRAWTRLRCTLRSRGRRRPG